MVYDRRLSFRPRCHEYLYFDSATALRIDGLGTTSVQSVISQRTMHGIIKAARNIPR